MDSAEAFKQHERDRAVAWKLTSPSLPDEARAAGRYVRDGVEQGPPLDVCLPPALAGHSLLAEVRAMALELFAELGIPWHASIDGGPSNHLLSSQVQCVNALGQMVHDPE